MQDQHATNGLRPLRIAGALEWVLWAIAVYAIPIAIGVAALLAVFFWEDVYSSDREALLEMQVLTQAGNSLAPAAAVGLLKSAPTMSSFEAKSIEGPVWIGFRAPAVSAGTHVVEVPSRHAATLSCWDATSLELLGDSKVADDNAAFSQAKTGYALNLIRPSMQVICRATFLGPARLTVELWKSAQFDRSVRRFHRMTGLMDGGLITLAMFVLVAALINRQPVYVIYAGWLIATLRSTAISAGWDIQWLGYAVPDDWLVESRSLTRAAYALLTLTLFRALFKADLLKTPFNGAIRFTHWITLPLLLAAVTLPRSIFIPALWCIGGPGLLLMIVSLVSIVRRTRSSVVLWYGASLSVTILASLSEIVAAVTDSRSLIGPFYAGAGAITSSLLASFAIAEQMRQEHLNRLSAQAELQHTYDALPIGLFTLDLRGRFLSANPALISMLGANVLVDSSSAWKHYFSDEAWTQLSEMVDKRPGGDIEVKGRTPPGHGAEAKRFIVRAALANDKIEGTLQDVTDSSKATEDLQFLVNHDPLTKTLNRRGIEAGFEVEVARVATGRPLALAYMDLDHFKLINEQFSHAAGDDVLRQVCQRTSGMLPKDLLFGRIGGDEFVIMFPDTSIELATLLCRGIIDSIRTQAYRVGDKAFLHVRCSIGLVEVAAGMRFNEAISSADRACVQAKSASGAGLVVVEVENAAAPAGASTEGP